MESTEQFVHVNGVDLYVLSVGQGPAVLLLHGFPDNHTVWRLQIDVLAAAGYRVIAPDLRGYGQSGAPEPLAAYEMRELRKDVIGLLDALGIDKIRLVGHDWGASLGWQLCMYSPERVACFAALSVGHPNAFARAGLAQRFKSWYMGVFLVRGLGERALQAFNFSALRRVAATPVQFQGWRRQLAAPGRLTAALNYYRANTRLGYPREYPAVSLPVLGVWGDHDFALTEEQMTSTASYLGKNFRYERIEGAGHWIQLDVPARLNALLLDFFRTCAPD